MDKRDIKSMNRKELAKALDDAEAYRVGQVYKWLHTTTEDFEGMQNLPLKMRKTLAERYFVPYAEIIKKRISRIDGTVKFLNRLYDGETVESVLMKYKHGYSICISTQIGCKMGCAFCATGQGGFVRDLLPAEMEAQIQAAAKEEGIRISNVVLMGMGEPLDNYDNVLRFLELISEDAGMNIGMRHISLSTCGIVDKIYTLAERKLQLTLSVSLHAPNDEIRNRTMPVNHRWNIAALLKACKYYSDQTKRRISFEYAMIQGVNDTDACARELAKRLRGIHAHVNLIPVNDVSGTNYRSSSGKQLEHFRGILEKQGYSATVRRTLGADIEASCGQLRKRYIEGDYNDR